MIDRRTFGLAAGAALLGGQAMATVKAKIPVVIAHRGGPRRLYAFTEEQFGQELGLIYAAPGEVAELRPGGPTIRAAAPPEQPPAQTRRMFVAF